MQCSTEQMNKYCEFINTSPYYPSSIQIGSAILLLLVHKIVQSENYLLEIVSYLQKVSVLIFVLKTSVLYLCTLLKDNRYISRYNILSTLKVECFGGFPCSIGRNE